jgi:hypothetical protein
MPGSRRHREFWNLLRDALMRSCLVEVLYILIEDALELLLVKDQQVVEAFLPHTPQEAFADSIGSWCVKGGFENLNSTRCRHASKAKPKFAIVITNQILWRLPIRQYISIKPQKGGRNKEVQFLTYLGMRIKKVQKGTSLCIAYVK